MTVVQTLNVKPDGMNKCVECGCIIGGESPIKYGLIALVDGKKYGMFHSRDCAIEHLKKEGVDLDL